MTSLKYADLCAGYGGLGLAIEEVFGAEPSWFSEFEEDPSRILAYHWPTVPNYGDMTTIDWSLVPGVDILAGGTPCQDLSHAGRRRGMTEGTRSNLWSQMREAIATIRPTYVVWENVRGAYSAKADSDLEFCPGCMGDAGDQKPSLRALGRVLGDLADLGYDCQWRGLRASDVGAPHPRFRVFILATLRDDVGADVERVRPGRVEVPSVADGPRKRRGAGAGPADADNLGHERSGETWDGRPGFADGGELIVHWGKYEPAIRRWESALGRRAPAPTVPSGRNGNHQLSPWFTEWMMGLPEGWICDPAIWEGKRPGSVRNAQLKAAGNGVVPQQAAAALRDMLSP